MKVFRHPLVATLSVVMLAARLLAPDVWHDCANAMVSAGAVSQDAAAQQVVAHDAMALTATAHTAMAHTAMAHDAPAPDAHSHEPAAHQEQPDEQSHQCDCDTDCCCVATPATRPDGHTLAAPPTVEARLAPVGSNSAWVPARTDLRLPFNTPPPASLS